MDCTKVGNLIFQLRSEKNMTQKQLASAMNISDRTISKWERGLGSPDVSLLNELSNILEVNIEKILSGTLNVNELDIGNMQKTKFYVCPCCNNLLFSTGESEISCCGRKLFALHAMEQDNSHCLIVEEVENEYFITTNHEMSKSHFISFVAYVACDRVLLVKLYPEQTMEIRFPKMHGCQLYAFCNQHGLSKRKIK